MISFIIIGKNIEPTIRICLDSVFNFIKKNNISDYEVIYSDSDSTDNSVKIASQYQVKIVQLKGELNAAVGRNEGAKVSKGSLLFFIDGDMELIPDCFPLLFKNENQLVYPFLRGAVINKYYSCDYCQVIKEDVYTIPNNASDYYERNITGGLFVIERKYWEQLGGMDDSFSANEDSDFGLRMASIGIKQRVYNKLMVVHNMVSYYDLKRMRCFITTDRLLFSGVLIRKHLFNKTFIPTLIRSRYSLLLLTLGIISLLSNIKLSIFISNLYFLLQIMRSLRLYKSEPYFFFILIYKLFYDIYSIVGFLFYYPSNRIYQAEFTQK